MAVIKNGKIHGKIGHYVYRVVNGTEIIQSSPRKIRLSKKMKVENEKFSSCAVICSRLYRIVKDFALHQVDYRLYNRLMSKLRMLDFTSLDIRDSARLSEWTLISSSQNINIHHKQSEYKDEGVLPKVSFSGEECKVLFSGFQLAKNSLALLADAVYMELSFSLIHYDFDKEIAQPVFGYTSQRLPVNGDSPLQELSIELDTLAYPVKRGILLPCFGIRFYAYRESSAYLNSDRFSPFTILGIWYA